MMPRVAISRRLLNEGEHVVVSTRTHVKALLVPALWLILVAGGGRLRLDVPGGGQRAAAAGRGDLDRSRWWSWSGWWSRPFLRWLTTTYTVTNRRLITRTGVLTRRGHDIPLPGSATWPTSTACVDRMLGCGTLVISDASEQGRVRLHDIPHVEQVQLQISDLLFGHTDGPRPAGNAASMTEPEPRLHPPGARGRDPRREPLAHQRGGRRGRRGDPRAGPPAVAGARLPRRRRRRPRSPTADLGGAEHAGRRGRPRARSTSTPPCG